MGKITMITINNYYYIMHILLSLKIDPQYDNQYCYALSY